MKQTRLLMGMPISLEIAGVNDQQPFNAVYDYFQRVDDVFSTYRPDTQVMQLRAGLPEDQWSSEVREVMDLAEQTKQQTNGYFDVYREGILDPSGLVKGWAVQKAAELLQSQGYANFCIDAGGDMQTSGTNEDGEKWQVGIRNPFNRDEMIKVVSLRGEGIATSGTAIRGQHIYDPHEVTRAITDVVSITVIGTDVYEADRFATAAFAMGVKGIEFIESLPGLEAYMVTPDKRATMTSRFQEYCI